jgi:polyhydroxybutyrate depolymerase
MVKTSSMALVEYSSVLNTKNNVIKPNLTNDGLHPNQLGYDAMFIITLLTLEEVVKMRSVTMQKFIILFFTAFGFINSAFAQDNSDDVLPSIIVDGVQRDWRIYVPTTYAKENLIPLVLDFHGTSGTPKNQASLSEFEKLAELKRFIVVTPAAKYIPEGGRVTWNVDKHTGVVDDVAFIHQLIEHLKLTYSIDPKRVYATGFSGGARMSSRLGCDLSQTIAAIGPVAGVRYPEDCQPTRPVPLITFHGKKDNVNHYEHQQNSPSYWRMGVEDALAGWIKHNQCQQPATEQVMTAEVTKLSYLKCQLQADIVFYRSEDAGHTWPGSPRAEVMAEYGLGKTDADISATELIWQFFESHPLQ